MRLWDLQCTGSSPGRWSRGWLCDRRPCPCRLKPAAVYVLSGQNSHSRYNFPSSCWVWAWATCREILPWRYRLARQPPDQTAPDPSACWREFPGVSWMLWISKQREFFCRRYWTLWISYLLLTFPSCSHTPQLLAEILYIITIIYYYYYVLLLLTIKHKM